VAASSDGAKRLYGSEIGVSFTLKLPLQVHGSRAVAFHGMQLAPCILGCD
jgi:hypothetical protein